MNNSRPTYPGGSIWRRWDLHVHSPESFQHNFRDWDSYVQALHSVKGVSVLGVTDYFVIDGYKRLRSLRNEGQLTNFDLILPNV